MPDFNLDLSQLDADEAGDLPSATYFILETHDDCILASIEEATEFSVHIGLPNRPDRRHAFKYYSFADALQALAVLKTTHPEAGLWLSCEEILEEILGDDVVFGAVIARASVEPDDFDDPWRRLAAEIDWKAARGQPLTTDELIQEVAALA